MSIRDWFERLLGRTEDRFRGLHHHGHPASFWHGDFSAEMPPMPPMRPSFGPHPAPAPYHGVPLHPEMARGMASALHPHVGPHFGPGPHRGFVPHPGLRPGFAPHPGFAHHPGFGPHFGPHPGFPHADARRPHPGFPHSPAPPAPAAPFLPVPSPFAPFVHRAPEAHHEHFLREMHPRRDPHAHFYDRYAPPPPPPPSPEYAQNFTSSPPAEGTGDTSDEGYDLLQSLPSTAEQDAGLVPGPVDPTATDAGQTVVPDTGASDSNGQQVAPGDTSADSSNMAGEPLYGGTGNVLGKSYEGEIDLPMELPADEDLLDVATAMLGHETCFAGSPHRHMFSMYEGPSPMDSFAAIHDAPRVESVSFGAGPGVEDLDWGAAFLGDVAATDRFSGRGTTFGGTPLESHGAMSGEMNPDFYRQTTIKL
jgi:hypothetical protein